MLSLGTYLQTWLTVVLLSPLLLWPLPAAGKDVARAPIQVRSHEFANGLALYHARVPEASSFFLSATVWVGSVDEDPKLNGGVSHLLEHILFHQPGMSQPEFTARIESVGGQFNGKTSSARTSYDVQLPGPHFELGQKWLHQVLFHDNLVTDRLNEEKEIVNREKGWSAPTWWQRIWQIIFPDYLKLPGFWETQFGLPKGDQAIGGTYQVARKLTAAQLQAHYQAYYYPENMVLVYVGPHKLEEVVSIVQATFGSAHPTGRKPNLRSILENAAPRSYFDHNLPSMFSTPAYSIGIGDIFTGLRFSQYRELGLYRFVLVKVLEERFRYEQGKAYSVSDKLQPFRGAGFLMFELQASSETYWQQLDEVKRVVWGDLEKQLTQKDYERYKMAFLEQEASVRDVDSVHRVIWKAMYEHPRHRPMPDEASPSGPGQTPSYQDFLAWAGAWRGQTVPSLILSMPAVPFPYVHLVLFVLAIGMGVGLSRSFLRRPFPQESIQLMTRVSYGLVDWIQLGFCYAAACTVYSHVSWGTSYGMLYLRRFNALAMVSPYLDEVVTGLLIGVGIVLGGLMTPRKVLVTRGALVLKMRSPLFFRTPLTEIVAVETVDGWTAWMKLLRFKALPVAPWFVRGLLIHRKTGRPLVLHTPDDSKLQALLSSRVTIETAVSTPVREHSIRRQTVNSR
ncbi:MAG: M16 family metallopeptidase [Nitrospiraceae bacterium]